MTDGSNVVLFPGLTTKDLDPDVVLSAARGQLSEALVLGYDKNGREYFAGSHADAAEALWLIERLKMLLLAAGDD